MSQGFVDPTQAAVDKTLRDIRDVFHAWLQADPERDPDFDFNYAGAPVPMKLAVSRVKQERFVEDTKEWEEQLFQEEIKVAKDLGISADDIAKIQKWESPLRKQVEISLRKITYPLLRLWRRGPDFIFDLFRKGVNKDAYQKTVAPRMGSSKSFEDEISEGDRVDESDYEGTDGDQELSADSDLGEL